MGSSAKAPKLTTTTYVHAATKENMMSDNGLDLLAARQRASEQAAAQSEQSAPAPVDETVKVDPIKALALEKALNHANVNANASAVVDTAKAFEAYLRGSDV